MAHAMGELLTELTSSSRQDENFKGMQASSVQAEIVIGRNGGAATSSSKKASCQILLLYNLRGAFLLKS